MANNGIGCSANKTTLVDPNAFDGQSSVSNISVPLEDLSIFVELGATKKSRTLLTTSKQGIGVANSKDEVTVNFISGEKMGDERVLTTKFTDLTTTLNDSNESQNLGISSIDIDFSSSYAPLITINFIDVRGSAIFQNEELVASDDNKYSIFFELPYPLYRLTIKGYYGQPVTYCLHMTKFTSRFNSQTGNFEITTSFVGYTYAILSDMLLGYLKAIEYTDLGKSKYDELRKIEPNLLTLNELYTAISQINTNVKKLLASDSSSIQLSNGEEKKNQLSDIKNIMSFLGQEIDYNKTLDRYDFIIVDKKNSPNIENSISNYNTNITKAIEDVYNANTEIKLNVSDFNDLNSTNYKGLKLSYFKTNDPILDTIFANISDANGERQKTIKTLYTYLTSSGRIDLADNLEFEIYDNRNRYVKIKEASDKIDVELEHLKKDLAKTLRLKIRQDLGFDPTVRNIINVFATAVEVFLFVLYKVSEKADDQTNLDRINELKKVFVVDSSNKNVDIFDIKPTDIGNNNLRFYPWPDYRSVSETNGLVEEYLGKAGVLDNPTNVTELAFIDDLLKAFLKQSVNQSNTDVLIQQSEKNWYGLNPFDTRLFIDKFPYKRLEINSHNDAIFMAMLRAVTVLGYSNDKLTTDEIKEIANIEADAMINDIQNDVVLQALTQVKKDNFIDISGKVTGDFTNVVKEYNGKYYYDYIFESGEPDSNVLTPLKVIPLNKDFIGTWASNYMDKIDDNGVMFFTNYTTTKPSDDSGAILTKKDDGGLYLSIIEKDDYYGNSALPLISPQQNVKTTLNLQSLSTPFSKFSENYSSVGFNLTGGVYGTQEFTKLNYGKTNLDNFSFMYMFYDNSVIDDKGHNKVSGLAFKRKTTNDKTSTVSVFDITGVTVPLCKSIDSYMYTVDCGSKIPNDLSDNYSGYKFTSNLSLHKDYGKNRELAYQYLNGTQDITYPYINFNVYYEDAYDGKNLIPVSLFGSNLYYNQTSDKAKALLFLHTFPWNGLLTNGGIFDKQEILNTFAHRAGFISAPKLWVAFIGAMLWRTKQNTDPLVFSVNNASLLPKFGGTTSQNYPNKYQYLTYKSDINTPMSFKTDGEYKNIDTVLLTLPEQAKLQFINYFESFVTNDWPIISNQLEVLDTQTQNWNSTYDALMNNPYFISNNNGVKMGLVSLMKNAYSKTNNNRINFDNYIIFTPIIGDSDYKYNFFLELKDDTQAVKTIMDYFTAEVIISNSTHRIWLTNKNTNSDKRSPIIIEKTDLELYIDTIINKLNGRKDSFSIDNKVKNSEQSLFGTSDESVIKLMLYRTCKNLYDKWIGGSADAENVIFQCGGRNDVDYQLAKKRGHNSPKLIDSFRFVTRSFRDIGDELAINPTPIIDYLRDNPNSSFYDVVTNLLSSNNFDFIPLPAFINYNDPETLASIFKPYSYYETQGLNSISGPSFVCVYVGQKSKNLDFNNSNYTNDGFDIRCQGGTIIGAPIDFTKKVNDGEDSVTFFNVTFGQQNQNIFKDIVLDQNEFSETAESLQITDDISKKGLETNRTLAGQNIYNVYSVRSYKVEIEMLGDAMIQPMMYFQLNNIPMFHGAYMITNTKHKITPNHMSTHFTGVRLRKPETQLFGVGDLYMSLVDTIDSSSIKKDSTTKPFGILSGNWTLGTNCGSFKVPNIVDGVTGYQASKPIRDLVALVESNGDYNAYNSGIAGIKKGNFTPSTMTIGEIILEQKNGNIFAVGKYQLIPETFKAMVKALNFNNTDVFNADKQEKAGEWLILKGSNYREGLISYFSSGSLGNEEDLQKAITDLALEFSSFPSYFGTDSSEANKYLNPIGYNSNTSLYGGSAGNPASSKFCAQDVAKALIETWKNLHPNKKPNFDYSDVVAVA